MGVNVHLRDERGKDIEGGFVSDERSGIARLVKGLDPGEYPFLGSIDIYGDTVFNRKQFLEEWQRLSEPAHSSRQGTAYASVAALAERCQSQVHLYLWFMGD